MKNKNLSKIANGDKGKPTKEFRPLYKIFNKNASLIAFAKRHFDLQGTFDKHYWSSISNIFEQECRLGVALLAYAQNNYSTDYPLLL